MHLKSIKLIGFKSFVDATTIEFTDSVNAVVGPNGCGKSNIIDAVRWVLGASSAQSLRTKHMASVIFAGSSSRAPYSQASVELIFDNSSKRIGGEYAGFAQLSIKRSINSDGVSTYSINGGVCRRRDIQDLFYGIGIVGSGSYAIIEQGTINRFTEARPEELREILEEAAGTSRYKERRRETLRRLESTSENLARVSDNLQQLEEQIDSLSAQSQQARAFRDLQARSSRLETEITFLRLQQLDEQIAHAGEQLQQARARLQDNRQQLDLSSAELSGAEVELDSQQRQYNQVNQQKLELTRAVAERRSELNLQRAQLEGFEGDSQRLQQARGDIESLLTQDQLQIEQHSSNISAWEPEHQRSQQELEQASAQLRSSAAELENAQDAWQEWQQQHNQLQSQAEIARNQLESLETRAQELQQRRGKLQAASAPVDASAEHQQQAQLATEQQQLQAQLVQLEQDNATTEHELQKLHQQVQSTQQELQQADSEERELNQALAAARALIQHLERKHPKLAEWLQARSIDPELSIDKSLRIAPGWERALETALGTFLQARLSSKLDSALQEPNAPPTPVALVDASATEPAPAGSLASQVLEGNYPAFLASIQTAEDSSAALARRSQLGHGQSIITRSGLWLGRNWALLSPQQDNSLIEQRRKYSEVAERLQQIQQRQTRLQQQLQDVQQQREQCLAHNKSYQQQRQELQLKLERSRHQAQRLQDQLDNQQRQRQLYAQELDSLEQQLQELTEQQSQQRQLWSQSLEQLEQSTLDDDHQQQLQSSREQHQRAQERERALQQQSNEHSLRLREAQVQINSLRSNVERAQQQLANNAAQRQQLLDKIGALQAQIPELEQSFQQSLQEQLTLEEGSNALSSELGARRDAVAQLGKKCNSLRVQEQKIIAAIASHEQQLQSLGGQQQELAEQHPELDRAGIAASIDCSTSSKARQRILQSLREQIEAMGAVNLLAEVQHGEAVAKHSETARQVEELRTAQQSLETAIDKIDSESRAALKQTLDTVNVNLKREFARVFSGGQAQLSAEPGDLLESGLVLFAQPAGKKITQISALSGGEKALTALALVFAIFALNPAPFCLLDEVDAPLDENNTNRFARLVQEFSRRSQFIIVTHNRISMEIADKLIGITMNEPGVSRSVSVNLADLSPGSAGVSPAV